MRYHAFFLISLGICFGFSCSPSPDSGTSHADTSFVNSKEVATAESDRPMASVGDIQAAYSEVTERRKRGELDSVSFEYSCREGETSGTVTYFSHDGDLQLVVHRYSEYSHYSAEDYYFVRDSALYFAFLKGVSWSFEDGPEGATRDNIRERRLYLLDQQPVKCLQKEYVIRSHANDNPRPETLANTEVDCASSSSSLLAAYRQLLQHRNNPPASGCL